MRKTKIGALLLACVLFLCTGLPALAAEAAQEMIDYAVNGSFETLLSSGVPSGWLLPNTAKMGVDAVMDKETVHDGTQALKLATADTAVYLSQKVSGLKENTKYTLKVWTWIRDEGPNSRGGAIKLEYSGPDETGTVKTLSGESFPVAGVSRDWEQQSIDFITPPGANGVRIYLRMWNGGEILWDDVQLLGEAPPDLEPRPLVKLQSAYNGASDLIVNGDFEKKTAQGGAAGWTPMGGSWTEGMISLETGEKSYGGSGTSVKISTETGGNPWVRQRVPVQPRTKYGITVWVRTEKVVETTQGAVRFKYEGINKDGVYMSRDTTSSSVTPENERQWTQQYQEYTTPDNCYFVDFYLRLHATGTVWFDNVTFTQIAEAPLVSLSTDCVFYYPEQAQGFASAIRYTEEAVYADFALKDGETVLFEQKDTEFFEEKATFAYNLSYLTEKTKEYTVAVTVKDVKHTALQTLTTDIYKYDRPAVVDENLNYLNTDGSTFIPTIGYHVPQSWYENCAAAGINTVQIAYGWAYIYPTKPQQLDSIFADLKKYNMKGIICLYYGMVPATHPKNIESTKAVVEAFKDNENVFGYAVMDEPFAGIPNAYEDAPRYLKDAYKLIRSIDTKHPVYCLEAAADMFTETAKYCDVLVYDPYPSNQHEPATHIRNLTEMAVQAARGVKPTYAVHQAFLWRGYFPTITEVRNFWYQALLSDSHGEGYYCIEKAYESKNIDETELWPGLTEFAAEEQEFAYDTFGYGEYPLFNQELNTSHEYRSVLKEGKVYLVILNRENIAKTVQVPLTSMNKKVSLAESTVKAMFGAEDGDAKKEGNLLSVQLAPRAAAVFSFDAADVSAEILAEDRYTDLIGYDWAKHSIETLSAEGLVEGVDAHSFAPSVPVTRADFARSLINTLGISARKYDIAASFSDVAADARYAREIAIGKAVGIFTGMGDGTFAPEANITRQDAIVLCVRALRYINRLGGEGSVTHLDAYTDGAQVSDYAKFPMANMIAASIIKGDDTGALNPFANLTRAESAVVMLRMREIGNGL